MGIWQESSPDGKRQTQRLSGENLWSLRNSGESGGVAEEKLGRGHGECMVSEGAAHSWARKEHGLGGDPQKGLEQNDGT